MGTATGLDVAQQETVVALLYAAIPPLEEQLKQTVYALAVLIGRTPESIDVTDGTLTALKSPPVVAGTALQAPVAASRHRRGRTAADRRECRHHRGPRRSSFPPSS